MNTGDSIKIEARRQAKTYSTTAPLQGRSAQPLLETQNPHQQAVASFCHRTIRNAIEKIPDQQKRLPIRAGRKGAASRSLNAARVLGRPAAVLPPTRQLDSSLDLCPSSSFISYSRQPAQLVICKFQPFKFVYGERLPLRLDFDIHGGSMDITIKSH